MVVYFTHTGLRHGANDRRDMGIRAQEENRCMPRGSKKTTLAMWFPRAVVAGQNELEEQNEEKKETQEEKKKEEEEEEEEKKTQAKKKKKKKKRKKAHNAPARQFHKTSSTSTRAPAGALAAMRAGNGD